MRGVLELANIPFEDVRGERAQVEREREEAGERCQPAVGGYRAQQPAYEWALSDSNPPIGGWAAWRIYSIERGMTGRGDRAFLKKAFHKLLLGYGWWANRVDQTGDNVFEGGFLGLDNIGVFDRRYPLPDGSRIEQSDGTAWMAQFPP